ncbi:SRPBCC domain-containing protein [Catenuloplanes indicus JCM 9534]
MLVMDRVFKALADPTRRRLLDSLRGRDGQTLGELCAGLDMARQSATQHLGVLEEANLISTVRRGREKVHYLNPVPINEIRRRWIAAFDEPRLAVLEAIKERAMVPDYVYVTYIRSTAERVWAALTDADLTAAYWGHSNRSDWQPGSTWEHLRTDGSGIADGGGVVVASEPPRRLVITFGMPGERVADGASTVTFEVEPWQEIVRLTVTHTRLPSDEDRAAVSLGWPAVLANLKSLLETGEVLPQAPWEWPGTNG